jgi:hypothetical protein
MCRSWLLLKTGLLLIAFCSQLPPALASPVPDDGGTSDAPEAQMWGPGAADPDSFSPVFPSPAAAINGSTTLRVRPATVRFSVAAGSSSVLTAAVARYRAIMFAWGPGEGREDAHKVKFTGLTC